MPAQTSTTYIGERKHFAPYEVAYFKLLKQSDDTPYTGGVFGTTVFASVYLPDGITVWDKTTSPVPAFTFTEINTGLYRLALWGEGQPNGHNKDLSQEGDVLLQVRPAASEFWPITQLFSVRSDFDVKFACTSVPGPTAGQDILSGVISISRWFKKTLLDKPLTAAGALNSRTSVITGLSVTITDKNGSTLVTLSGADFFEGSADGDVYFHKTIAGLTGAKMLVARVTFDYVGVHVVRDFPIQNRWGA